MLTASTASPSPVHEAVASVHAMTDQYVAANPQAKPVPVMTWQEMERLKARGLVKFPERAPLQADGKAYVPKEGQPITPAPVRDKERERRRLARLAKIRRSRIANPNPRPFVETKQPLVWNEAKLHNEVEREFRAREKGELP
jgi:hypothetical protein